MKLIAINCTTSHLCRSENPNMLKEEFGEKVDFSLKQGEKVKINVGSESKKMKKETGSFPAEK